jgi:hypothetical protein
LAVLRWSPVLAFLCWSPVLAVLYWQLCTSSPVLAVCSGISDLHAINFLSRFACLIWTVLFRLSFSGYPNPAILSCLSCPILPVPDSACLSCLSCFACPIMPVCPVLPVLFHLSCSTCPGPSPSCP